MKNLNEVGEFITRKYKVILLIAAIFTIIMLFFLSKLKLNMQFMDTLPSNEPAVISYKNARENFDSLDNIIVGIEGNKKDIEDFILTYAPVLKDIESIESVEYQSELEFLKKHGLLLYKASDLNNLSTSLQANNLKEFIEGINENFEKTYTNSSDSEKLDKDKVSVLYTINFIEDFLKNIKSGKLNKNDSERFLFGERYYISPDKTLGLITIKSKLNIDNIPEIVNSVNEIEFFLKEKAKNFNVKVDLTGTHVITRDEMVVSEKDATFTSTLSLVLIFILFISSFRLLRYSLLVLVPLICGVIWSMGITYLLIGSLNMITAMMGAILIGLGIDYSIHIVAYFIEEKENGKTVNEAIINLFNKVMKGVIAGAITTAIGFFMFSFSTFPGFSEFGIVLGIGIISALSSAIFVLPSLLIIFGKKNHKLKKKSNIIFENLEKIIVKNKIIILIIFIVFIVFFSFKAITIEFETDMMEIEPKGLASVELNRKIIRKFDFSSDNSILVSNSIEEAQALYEKADKLKSVGEVISIGQYLPSTEKQKRRLEILKTISASTSIETSNNIEIDEFSEELYRLESNLIELADLAYMGGEIDLQEKCDNLIDSNIIPNLAENLYSFKENIMKSQLTFISSLKKLIKSTSIKPFTINSLPATIKSNYIGKNNKYLTIILPKNDLWEFDFQKIHMSELKQLSDEITGSSIIFLKVIEAEISEGKKVLILTVFSIFIILLIDLRSLKYAILAILPMLITVIFTLGIMVTLGMKLDVVNIIGLPLIIGIGVDDGVHIIHRYLREGNLKIALSSTGKAITLTTLTTIAAFGTLVLAKYRGFVNFGKLLFLGVGSAYIVTIFFLIIIISFVDKTDISE